MRRILPPLAGLVPLIATPAFAGEVKTLKVTALSTMLADRGVGDWGYAALVGVDGRKILFDIGAHPGVAPKNAEALGINLLQVEDVVISRHHGNRIGGLDWRTAP